MGKENIGTCCSLKSSVIELIETLRVITIVSTVTEDDVRF